MEDYKEIVNAKKEEIINTLKKCESTPYMPLKFDIPTAIVCVVGINNLKFGVKIFNSYDIKDSLKNLSFRYNGMDRVWEKSFDTIDEIVVELKKINLIPMHNIHKELCDFGPFEGQYIYS